MGGCSSSEPTASSPRGEGSPRRRRRLKDAKRVRQSGAAQKNSADFTTVDSITHHHNHGNASGTPPPLASSAAASSGDRTNSRGSLGVVGLTSNTPPPQPRSPDPRRQSGGRSSANQGNGTPTNGSGKARGDTPPTLGDATYTGSSSALQKGHSSNPLSLLPSYSSGGELSDFGCGGGGGRRNNSIPLPNQREPDAELRPLSDVILSPGVVIDDDEDDGDDDGSSGPGSDRDVRQLNNGRSMSASNVVLADITGEVTWVSEPDSRKYRQGSTSGPGSPSGPGGPGSRKASANLRIPPLLRSSSRNE